MKNFLQFSFKKKGVRVIKILIYLVSTIITMRPHRFLDSNQTEPASFYSQTANSYS